MKIRPMGTDLFHGAEHRQTDMTKLIVAFRNFAKAPVMSGTIPPLHLTF